MKPRLLYAVYLVAVTAVWLYVQFPARTIQAYVVQKARLAAPELSVAVAAADFRFPLGVRLERVKLSHQGAPALDLEWLDLQPGWRILLPGQAEFGFTARLAAGRARGRVALIREGRWMPRSLRLDLEAVQVAAIPLLSRQAGREITGACSSQVVYTPEEGSATVQAELVLENGRVEIRQPMIRRRDLSFARVDSRIEARGRAVALRRLTWQGTEIDGELSGHLEIKTPLEASAIEIRGELRPHPGFLAELRQTIPERLMPKPGPGGRYAVQLTGTLARPQYRLR